MMPDRSNALRLSRVMAFRQSEIHAPDLVEFPPSELREWASVDVTEARRYPEC